MNAREKTSSLGCHWRWRFQPVWGMWGHLGIDYCFENPRAPAGFLLRHIDYGLPGDATQPGYRQSIARYSAMNTPNGVGWPPLRTPHGHIFLTSEFESAPETVGLFLLHRAPRFWGTCGAYRTLGPNSNTGLRRTLIICEAETGYRFGPPSPRMRLGAHGWSWPGRLAHHEGPCPGYFHDDSFRWREPDVAAGNSPRDA